MTNTNDLSKFGTRELKESADLLRAWTEHKTTKLVDEYFGYNGVRLEFNQDSGNVFLVDDDYNVAMMNGELLDLFIVTPDEGKEGFFDELVEEYNEMTEDDKEYLKTFDTECILSDEEDKEQDMIEDAKESDKHE